MEQIIFFIIVWSIVFLVIPLERVKELSIVAFVAFTWMVFVDNISTYLGYYSYQNSLFSLGKAPLFQNLAEAGIGILMINWLKENSFVKLFEVIIVGISFVILHSIYIQRGTFLYGSFNSVLNFIHHIAALSIFLWLSLAIIGEQKVYKGNKSRIRFRHI